MCTGPGWHLRQRNIWKNITCQHTPSLFHCGTVIIIQTLLYNSHPALLEASWWQSQPRSSSHQHWALHLLPLCCPLWRRVPGISPFILDYLEEEEKEAEERKLIEGASTWADKSLEIIECSLANFREVVLIARASVTQELLPFAR
jgi:hypothetical protein